LWIRPEGCASLDAERLLLGSAEAPGFDYLFRTTDTENMKIIVNVFACVAGILAGFSMLRGGFGTLPLMLFYFLCVAEILAALSRTPVLTATLFNLIVAVSFWVLRYCFALPVLRGNYNYDQDLLFLAVLVVVACVLAQISWMFVFYRKSKVNH